MPRWLIWTFAAIVSWGLWAIVSKRIGEALLPAHSQALSTVGILPVIAALAWRPRPAPSGIERKGVALAFAAGILTCMGNLAYYAALQKGEKAATVVPLTALYPVLTIVFAVLALREKLNLLQGAGVVLSLVATYLFNVPGEHGMFSSAVLHALPPIALWGFSGFVQKLSTNEVSGEQSAFWFLFAFIPAAVVIFAGQPLAVGAISTRLWLLTFVLGLFFAFGNYAILAAFARDGKASVIAPLAGLYPLVSVPAAMAFLDERLSTRELLGLVFSLIAVAAMAMETRPVPAALANSTCHPSPNS